MQKGIIKNVNKLTGEPIDAKDLASMLSGIIGNESGVLTVFDELRLEKISDNKVRLHSGVYSLKGHILYIPKGSYEDFTIDSGTLGANRIDLLVAEYVKNGEGDGEDTLHFRVIKGESTSGEPKEPNIVRQDINQSGITFQDAIYRIRLTGTSTSIQQSFNKIRGIQALDENFANALKNQSQRIESLIPKTYIDSGWVVTEHPNGYLELSTHAIRWTNSSGRARVTFPFKVHTIHPQVTLQHRHSRSLHSVVTVDEDGINIFVNNTNGTAYADKEQGFWIYVRGNKKRAG